jgi:O-antigen ligase/tetratricopeptide (TPR) repeat protein
MSEARPQCTSDSFHQLRDRWSALLAWAIEGVLIALICLAPWAFGAVHLYFEFWLDAGLAVLLCLWAARILVSGQFSWQRCPVALCLAGLFLLSVVQLIPLSPALHRLVSPGGADLRESLYPSRPEILPGGVARAPNAPARSTISADPGATRSGALRLLAVFLAFALVRNNCTFPGSLRRLAIAAVANGTLLSLVALLQFFSSRANEVYWTYPAAGVVFGPFLCRNHYPFYVSLCFGLGLGLLLSRGFKRRSEPPEAKLELDGWRAVLDRLQDPGTVTLGFALALMLGSIVLSLSRGGAVSLLVGGLVCLFVSARSWKRSLQPAALLLVLGLGLGIVAFALGKVEARFAALWEDDASAAGRISMWQRVLPDVSQSPWLGTGLGTFGLVEPLSRPPGENPSVLWDHAHNDYLEALIEGGLARLLVSVLAIALVFRLGIRSYRAWRQRPEGGLVLGALLGFTAVVVHSTVDFGLHVPAVALLGVTVAAFLCMGCKAPMQAEEKSEPEVSAFRLGRIGSLVGAAMLVVLGGLLVRQVYREAQAERLRLRAARPEVYPDDRIALLEEAVAWTPDNASLQVELAEANFTSYRWRGAMEQHLLKLAPDNAGTALLVAGFRPRTTVWLAPALDHYIQARDACPLLPQPHLRIAALRDDLVDAEPCTHYLARAKKLRPADTEVWYIAGIEELRQGDRDEAWRSWRQALRCSRHHLHDIVARTADLLSPAELAAHVLPEDAEQLLEAALQLFPDPAAISSRRLLLDPALAILETRQDAASWHLKGRIHHLLGEPEPALAAYRAAISREPRQTDWRYEYAELLYQQSRFDLAREQLVTVLDLNPNHYRARTLLPVVNRKLPILP